MLNVSQLFVYPIKSLGGIALETGEVTERGFLHDRRWMLVDKDNQFLTQRTTSQLALLKVSIGEHGLIVEHKKNSNSIDIPFEAEGELIRVEVWSDQCKAMEVSGQVSQWFSDILGLHCRLVFMPDTSRRRVDTRYANNKEITSFTDGYPFMMIGQASLDDLNNRLENPLSMDRFRPSIVFTGGSSFEEDTWAHFQIKDINFYGVKLCARCVVTTIDQDEATKGKEPLATLSTYRQNRNKIYFGQNLLHNGSGKISVGDRIEVIERKKSRF